MKKTILTSVLIMLSCAAFAAVDTSTIDNATTIDNAKTAYQTAANKVIETYNGKIDEKEITSAKEQVTENINAVTAEEQNGTLSETIDNAEKSGGGDGVLSEEDSKAKIAELQENADAMKEREQSLANRLVSGASMGAMGIGGMQLASAAAEQSADAAAEQDMSAYLATFKCDYGQGMTINGGDLNITLPGANTLLPLYNEYTTLAADLKVRKEALGMTPGIESEVILDAATSGLYDNVGTGVTDGAFASVSRALMNTTGADAAEWNAQKAETAQQLKTGAITAGAGALVGIVGNVLINEVGDKTKEMSDEIIAKYEPLRKLRDNAATLKNQELYANCPSDSTGSWPNCECSNDKQIYNANAGKCETCPGDKVSIDSKCDCPTGTVPGDEDTCKPTEQQVTPKCDTSAGHVDVNTNDGSCTCTDGYILTPDNSGNSKCECPTETHEVNSEGECVEKTSSKPEDPALQETVSLASSNLFELNSYSLTKDATHTIEEFVADIKNALNGSTSYCIKITGHTDNSGTDKINLPLSQKRAKAVKDALVENGLSESNITAKGVGSSECNSTTQYDENCRKVEISFSAESCQSQ